MRLFLLYPHNLDLRAIRCRSGRIVTFETPRAGRFALYVDHLAGVFGHRDPLEPRHPYVTGLGLTVTFHTSLEP